MEIDEPYDDKANDINQKPPFDCLNFAVHEIAEILVFVDGFTQPL